MEEATLKRAKRKNQRSKKKELWINLCDLYSYGLRNRILNISFWEFLEACGLSYKIESKIKGGVEIKHYVTARQLIDKPLTNHEIMELYDWYK